MLISIESCGLSCPLLNLLSQPLQRSSRLHPDVIIVLMLPLLARAVDALISPVALAIMREYSPAERPVGFSMIAASTPRPTGPAGVCIRR